MSWEEEVAILLRSLFAEDDDLRRLVKTGPEGERLAGDLPQGDASLNDLARATVDLYDANGLLDAAFFDRLVAAKPGREPDIRAVAAKRPVGVVTRVDSWLDPWRARMRPWLDRLPRPVRVSAARAWRFRLAIALVWAMVGWMSPLDAVVPLVFARVIGPRVSVEDVVVVGFDGGAAPSDTAAGAAAEEEAVATRRARFADVITTAVARGARVVVFDVAMTKARPEVDPALATAITAAREKGTRVVLAGRLVADGAGGIALGGPGTSALADAAIIGWPELSTAFGHTFPVGARPSWGDAGGERWQLAVAGLAGWHQFGRTTAPSPPELRDGLWSDQLCVEGDCNPVDTGVLLLPHVAAVTPVPFDDVSAWPADLSNHAVFVGDVGPRDRFATLTGTLPGVVLHAQLFAALKDERCLRMVPWAVNALVVVLVAVAMRRVAPALKQPWHAPAVVGAVWLVLFVTLGLSGWWLAPIPAVLALVLGRAERVS
ncbi:MAG: CHASE2 domain-containing protein [Myxococcota bacterium]